MGVDANDAQSYVVVSLVAMPSLVAAVDKI